MAEQKVIDKAKAWADKEYDELRYSKCEKKHFVFTFRELREMGKQAFIAGHDVASEELKAQFEKLLDFAAERTEMCDVCPQTDNCINSEGTCPYAALDEEKATRKWIERYIKGAKHQNCKYYHGDVVTAFEDKDYDNPCLTCFKFDNWEAAE